MALWIGLDIGGTKCAAVAARASDGRPEILDKRLFLTADYPRWQDMCAVLADAAAQMCAQLHDEPVGIGISCGGPLDSRRGLVLGPPNLPGWDEVPITEFFSARFGIPAYLQNDANACAVAEWKFGAGQGCTNMVFLTFGTGLGAGLILDGRLYCGANDMAGEVGHIRLCSDGPVGYGKVGSFEGFCSGGGIAQLAAVRLPAFLRQGGKTALRSDDLSAKTLAEYADTGDEFALSVYAEVGEKLGAGLSVLVDILNPERIVIGSIYARAGHLLHERMRRVLRREALARSLRVCEVVPAALGEQLGDYAALGVLACHTEERV
ncbi:MAG: ROK family protein [Clostridia bacterium]|nr:ROK family protein [Clostridia bacterium]